MLKENLTIFRRLHLVFDLGLTALAIFLTLLVGGKTALLMHSHFSPNQANLFVFILPIWLFLLISKKHYYEYRMKNWKEILKDMSGLTVKGTGILIALLFIFDLWRQSRLLLPLFAVCDFLFLSGIRITTLNFLSILRKRGYNTRNLLVVGTGQMAKEIINKIMTNKGWGFKILGLLDWEKSLKGKRISNQRVIGTLDDIPTIVKNRQVDYMVYAVPKRFLPRVEGSIKTCEEMGVSACVLADFFPTKIYKKSMGEFHDKPAILFSTAPDRNLNILAKDTVDRISSLMGIILLSPVFLVTALLVKLTSRGPVFFRQQRCGLNGKRFSLYKFRTMVNNAEELKQSLLDRNEMDGPVFKIKEDPRITKLGKFLRKSSVDELPQLLNVLFGQMSLVGPRPPLPQEVSQYDLWQRRKLSMKPGITCLWQVNGRNNINFEKWMKLDLEYIDNWSLWLDTKILVKTVPVVLFGVGAR